MSTILPVYDWTRASAHVDKARSRAYPWDEWLDGQIRKLDRVEDFDGPAMSVERVIRTSANRRGIRVRIRVEGDSIYLQAHLDNARNTARGVTKSATKKDVRQAKADKAEGKGNGVAPSTVVKAKPAEKAPRARKITAEPATAADFTKAKATNGKAAPKTSLDPVEAPAKANGKVNGKAKTTATPRRKLVRS